MPKLCDGGRREFVMRHRVNRGVIQHYRTAYGSIGSLQSLRARTVAGPRDCGPRAGRPGSRCGCPRWIRPGWHRNSPARLRARPRCAAVEHLGPMACRAAARRYSRRISLEGCMSRWARSPSLVNSSRPGGIHVEPAHDDPSPARRRRQSLEYGRPALGIIARGHLAHGLVIQQHFDRFARGRRGPAVSHRDRSGRCSSARSPSAATRSLIVTRPARIHSSMPRRDPWPAPASNFCNRSVMWGGSITNCYMAIPSPASSLFRRTRPRVAAP